MGTRIHVGALTVYDEREVPELEELFVGAPVWVRIGEERQFSVRPSAVTGLEEADDA